MKWLLFIFLLMVAVPGFASVNVDALLKTNRNVEWLDKEIEKINLNLQGKHSFSTRRALEKQMDELKGRRKKVFLQFLEESSGVDIEALSEGKPDKKEKLLDEVQDILLPLLESIKRLSAKPRQLEKIKNDISKLHELINNRKKAKESLLNIQHDEQFISTLPLINQGIDELENEIIKLEIELDGKTRLIKKEEAGKTSFITRLRAFISDFVKTKGKNLFFSLTTLVLLYWVLLVSRNQVFKFQIFTGKLEFIRKTLMTLYSSISLTIAFMGAILVLYVLNDWLLLTLIVVILIGVLWSLKQYLPRYIGEARLILNIGPVKEGELIIWEGVPYLVKSLGFSATLCNPLLSGGMLRIPVQEFFSKQSRKISGNEALFPTQKDDWIRFDDGSIGQVKEQTPEVVSVLKMGGGIKTYNTKDFFGMGLENITKGFVISEVLGLDYSIQAEVLNQVVPVFFKKMKEYLYQESYIRDFALNFNCEFHSAGGSSLNLVVFLECGGELCKYYYKIKRDIQRNFVRIANEENLTIPFEQMTIHQG
ncbi:MAG: hypothetical protein A2381_18245 [Bdellovibrionales bacterium RIFOXYB1_FULL_37_110]|nr:MAG: hypothetical protein A2417_06710 [Bdellovibrionales bacterium RIFOXYC1_FULL_37_79]OFZ58613.1 MAG: hypothetical protein A2381_18245 [Bdellovibrionales bacterium RIFOXYB1_FULL_37_110]OFZ61725.1 MAG: hypothetical protein A2577_19445 [Bdellovibrionales bacterium RIFOXYD1_FULL_36_51]